MAEWKNTGSGSLASLVRDASTLSDAREAFQGLVETIWRLRQPDGCPWDRKQTHASIAKNMIEEAYEAVDCIESNDVSHLREELGDVLMQVVLHAQIAADAGEFTMADVARDIDQKLIRRHPHVFGDAAAQDAEEVLAIWDNVKLAEKEAKDKESAQAGERPEGLLDGVPTSLPALMQAQKVSRKAAAVGFEWETVQDVWDNRRARNGVWRRALRTGKRSAQRGDRRRKRATSEHGEIPLALAGYGRSRPPARGCDRGLVDQRAQ